MGIGRCGGGRYGGGHYGGRRYGGGRYGGASQIGVDTTAEPPESSNSHYYGRYGGDTAESLQYNDADVSLMITEKVLLCGNTLMKCCCGATLYFLRQRARSDASNFILCLELFLQPSWENASISLFGFDRFL